QPLANRAAAARTTSKINGIGVARFMSRLNLFSGTFPIRPYPWDPLPRAIGDADVCFNILTSFGLRRRRSARAGRGELREAQVRANGVPAVPVGIAGMVCAPPPARGPRLKGCTRSALRRIGQGLLGSPLSPMARIAARSSVEEVGCSGVRAERGATAAGRG